MKLTQKTLFQCFDKSKKDSTIILDETVDGNRDFDLNFSLKTSIFQKLSNVNELIFFCQFTFDKTIVRQILLPQIINGKCSSQTKKFLRIIFRISLNFVRWTTISQMKSIQSRIFKYEIINSLISSFSIDLSFCRWNRKNIKWIYFNSIQPMIWVPTLNRSSIGRQCFNIYKIIERQQLNKVDCSWKRNLFMFNFN